MSRYACLKEFACLVKSHCLSQIIEFENSTFVVTHTHKLSTVLSAHAGKGNYDNFYVIVINTIDNCAATVTQTLSILQDYFVPYSMHPY